MYEIPHGMRESNDGKIDGSANQSQPHTSLVMMERIGDGRLRCPAGPSRLLKRFLHDVRILHDVCTLQTRRWRRSIVPAIVSAASITHSSKFS